MYKRIYIYILFNVGQDSVVVIVTRSELGALGIKSQWRGDFLHLSRMALGPTQPPVPTPI